MENQLTEIIFLLDCSGSMAGLEPDTIGGFNSILEKQKNEDGKAYVTTILFNHEVRLLHDRLDLKEVPKLTTEDYEVGGMTALLDAMGYAMEKVGIVYDGKKSEKAIFIIVTDGVENYSKRFTFERIKRMVKYQKKQGAEFIFLGADMDAIAAAAEVGIEDDHAVEYRADKSGIKLGYDVIYETIRDFRRSGEIKEDWKRRIEEDSEIRKR